MEVGQRGEERGPRRERRMKWEGVLLHLSLRVERAKVILFREGEPNHAHRPY